MTTRTLRFAVAALTATAALTLTACGGSDGEEGKAAKDEQVTADAAAGDDMGGESTSDDENGQEQDKGDACGPGTVKIEARAVKSPVNHVLLVATNTSKSPCTAYGFPFLRFDQDQATAIAVEESKPKDKVTIAPGKSAYAGVLASAADGSGGTGRDAKQLSVTFQTPGGDPLAGDPSSAGAPGGSLHVDDSARTTYWVDAEDAALKW
ncbi:DUF4232 domain-containing protein [Streptomyces sp. UNOB3_S3]|uniref:DUF4232 domain-containing protein n=1 Tax=Streptomyces sp. UNOB3_S3 TaxID=2871682 RepID=UPI001E47CDC6|nr:DUF4232 domain-containing protein [Streptomyces sp. UNOB3_S3]MCC3778066.1 DUF4232 domain-containing protein [Streptomyces sp. UNOB3_S3]